MAKIIFVNADGSQVEVEAAAGEMLMQVAIENGIDAIVGECGGACQCATCHVYVQEPWLEQLNPVDEMEDAMLDGVAAERLPSSRLSCAVTVTDEMDGILVHLPESQF